MESRWEATAYTIENYKPTPIEISQDLLSRYSLALRKIVREQQNKIGFHLCQLSSDLWGLESEFLNKDSYSNTLTVKELNTIVDECDGVAYTITEKNGRKQSFVAWRPQDKVKDTAVILHEIGHLQHKTCDIWEGEVQASLWAMGEIDKNIPDIYEECVQILSAYLASYISYAPDEFTPEHDSNDYSKFRKHCLEVIDVRNQRKK